MGNYWRVCWFEGEDVFVENKERRNEERKQSEKERSEKTLAINTL